MVPLSNKKTLQDWNRSWQFKVLLQIPSSFKITTKFGYKYARLWLWNYLQIKRKIKYGDRFTCNKRQTKRDYYVLFPLCNLIVWKKQRYNGSNIIRYARSFKNHRWTQAHYINLYGRMIYSGIGVTHIYLRIHKPNKGSIWNCILLF